jgi:hypothetical protein
MHGRGERVAPGAIPGLTRGRRRATGPVSQPGPPRSKGATPAPETYAPLLAAKSRNKPGHCKEIDMNTAVIAAGRIGGNVARRLARAGHSVTVSFARDPAALRTFANGEPNTSERDR